MAYIWQHKGWPDLRWDDHALAKLLVGASRAQGRLLGKMEGLGFDLRAEAHLRTLTEDVVKSSEIEGEKLEADQVRSSIARRLGMDVAGLIPADRNVEGVVEMMMDATSRYTEPLTARRLFDWHAALFPTGRSGMRTIKVGGWREDAAGPMQVVSGPMGREKIHYEAPPAARVAKEMQRFLAWFAKPKPGETDALLIAGVAHLWFVTIHPFEDGNGRIARAVADMALARSEGTNQRFYSMSSQIRQERNDYYRLLEVTQKSDTDITRWQTWFLECLVRAIEGAQGTLNGVLHEARFWERFAKEPLNERQIKVLRLMFRNFEGKLTSSKWAKVTKSSPDTALRDIANLVERGALKKDAGGGRSTSYSLVL